jgi:GNAT superfamily N-acetyltransferase
MEVDLTQGQERIEGDPPVDPPAAAREAASVRKAVESERPRVVEALARAFYDDDVMRWFFPDDSRRLRQLRRVFDLFGERFWFVHDLSYTTDSVAGGALWMPPDKWRVSVFDQLRSMPAMASRIGLRDLPRSLRGFNLMESKHPHEPSHFYLPIIGVAPQWQGKGLGTALLQPILERCDREGSHAYLEATTPRSRACYERSGFKTTGEIVLPNGPTMWQMWREPQGG